MTRSVAGINAKIRDIAKVPAAEMLRRHGPTRGQLMGLRLRQQWPARRASRPEMSARQCFRVQELVPQLGRERALARVLAQGSRL